VSTSIVVSTSVDGHTSTSCALTLLLYVFESLQISYLQLDTKEWFSSLDAVDYIAMSCNESNLQAQRKRMRSALTEDANAAARTVQSPTRETRASSQDGETIPEVSYTSSDK